jgi:phosphatidate cytidylyltransferase
MMLGTWFESPPEWLDVAIQRLGEPVVFTIAGIFGLLVVSTILVKSLKVIKPGMNLDEVSQRISSWWLMAGVFTFAMVVDRAVSIFFFAFISFLALKEFFSLIPTRRADRRVLFWAYLSIPLQYYWVYIEWYGVFIIFIPVYMFLLLPTRMVMIGETEGFHRSAGTIHWGMMLTIYCISHTAFLLVLKRNDLEQGATAPGAGYVLFLVVLTQLNDVCQFLWGKSFGKRKIIPKVSPGKTWVGFLGGVGSTTLLAWWAGPHLVGFSPNQSIVAGLIISIAGFIGDVNISAVKRDLDVKDSGSTIPGHGGILDRIDSLTYTAPLFFHFVYDTFTFHTFGSAGPLAP